MIQLQCLALVEKFNVSPLVIGLVGTLWLRFLASTRIMADDWADRAVHDSEVQMQGATQTPLYTKYNFSAFCDIPFYHFAKHSDW
ncbi:hypothetical protein CDL12_23252 [Handroanthus impetiginosus]|uniref:Uncharacterized protein n=1 Tax=Handroanthus impetiginosus TaxID=429701 RepID=A0A2G9GFZ6_9LAMI|nr:hypothetical protein CDL12_23252 [Handroanthus impetiginosus]